jgi:hypothetical protein
MVLWPNPDDDLDLRNLSLGILGAELPEDVNELVSEPELHSEEEDDGIGD